MSSKKRENYFADMPLGFGAALMQNSAAMNYYTGLDAQHQKRILEASRMIDSKQEMKNFVANLASFYC